MTQLHPVAERQVLMALIVFGQGVSQIRGKIGGTVFSRNRGGAYARNFVVPTNPGSPAQVAIRGIVTFLVNKWNVVLSPAGREGWDDYAANVPMVNKVGAEIFLTGQQHFIRSNVPRKQAGFVQIIEAPQIYDLGIFTTPTMDIPNGIAKEVDININITDDWANSDTGLMTVSTSVQQNPTINYWKGPYLFGDSIDGDSAVPLVSPVTVDTAFRYNPGNKCFAQIRVLQGDGRMSTPVRIEALSV